jgi:homoserine dehydrogenase
VSAGVALLGSGQVARALAARVDLLANRGRAPDVRLLQVVNSRTSAGGSPGGWLPQVVAVAAVPRRASADAAPEIVPGADVVIDLTASDAVAERHADWLAEGRIVVTANKRGLGEGQARAARILEGLWSPNAYGDAATVGAGLGAVRRLRAFAGCGEEVGEVRGVLSGSLAWLFDHYDGSVPFPALVRRAHGLGFTEPDPREDVGGTDVVRKLRILARAVGWPVPDDGVRVDPRLAVPGGNDPWSGLSALEPGLQALLADRPAGGARLAVVARARPGDYVVGIEWLAADDPLAQRRGCENAIEIRSERYGEHALVLRGPGAGPGLTAAAVLEDLALALGEREGEPARAAA